MQLIFSLHADQEELRRVKDSLPSHPKFLFLRKAIHIELDNRYPNTKLRLYSCKSKNATYWFAYKLNRYTINHIYMTYEGDFDAKCFADALAHLVEAARPFDTPPLCVGEQILISEVARYVEAHVPGIKGLQNPTHMFYMSEAQERMVENLQLRSLPDGYDLGSSNPTDAKVITSYWKHAKEGDEEETRAKVTCFPSSCIRFNGEPVAFEMVSQAGQLTHLYVLEEHRGKGLGLIVELDLSQKMIRAGMRVLKCVELFNASLIDATLRLPYWTRVHLDDGSPLVNVFYELEHK